MYSTESVLPGRILWRLGSWAGHIRSQIQRWLGYHIRWMAGDENSIIDLKSRKRGCHGHDEDDCEPLTYCLR